MNDSLTKGDQARADILAAAKHLFLSQGYHGTSMRAIARAAGDRAVAGLYNHFPNKEAIFEALIEASTPYDDLFGALEDALAGVTTGPDFVRRALHAILTVMPQHYDFIQLAQIDLREFEGANVVHLLRANVFPRIAQLLQQLQRLPGIRPIEPVIWMRMMASLVIGFITTERIAPMRLFGDLTPAQWADQFADILLYGLSEPGTSPAFTQGDSNDE